MADEEKIEPVETQEAITLEEVTPTSEAVSPEIISEPMVVSETPVAEVPVTPPISPEPAPVPEPAPTPTTINEPIISTEQVVVTVPAGETKSVEKIEDYSQMKPSASFMAWLRAKAKIGFQIRKKKRLDRLMTLFEKKSQITNDMVEKLLHVSDTSATNYLNELIKAGRIRRTGDKGGARYEKI